ncbi:MAG: protein translocase subunit SecF [Thermomicrobiales bacterium]
MLDVVGKRKWYYFFSLAITIPGVVFLLLGGLKPGIDFTGGTTWELAFEKEVEVLAVRSILNAAGYEGATVQLAEGNAVLIRGRELMENSGEKARLAEALIADLGSFTELQLQTVGPTVGASITQRAIMAVALTAVGILAYIAYAFRKAPNPLRFGACAIVAMLHDVLVVVGSFAILGYFFGVEIDALFVTALLTVIGFSVHDTIVVFDRIRENVGRRAGVDFPDIVNYSLVQTMVRSINTSMTVVFTLLALYLFGGETIKEFVLALLIGIVSGTYSSIFNASLMLVVWEKREIPAFFDRLRGRNRALPA